jgi:hypothetical protein
VVWPHLMNEADRLGAAVRMATGVPKLADQYLAEIRELTVARIEAGVVYLIREPERALRSGYTSDTPG